LQTTNPKTLALVGRGGDPEKVLAAAEQLRDLGVVPLVDLLLGLPGDAEPDIGRAVGTLVKRGLHQDTQVFLLSVLPGTTLRAQAEKLGLEFESRPPYHVINTATLTHEQLIHGFTLAEEAFDRRLDEWPRPHLVEAEPQADPADVFVVDLDRPGTDELAAGTRPGALHQSLWLGAEDLYGQRRRLRALLARRLAVDPYCTLDVVLRPKGFFPLDLLVSLQAQLDEATPSYGTRLLHWRGENALRRLCVCYPSDIPCRPDLLNAMSRYALVYQDQTLEHAAQHASEIGRLRPAARIIGPWPTNGEVAWHELATIADAESISFASRALEKRWLDETLGYAEIGTHAHQS
jgi:hypothetical protein